MDNIYGHNQKKRKTKKTNTKDGNNNCVTDPQTYV